MSHNTRQKRATLSLMCQVRQGTRAWQWAHLDDLSPRGFKVAGLANANLQKPLSIKIPGLHLLSAWIRWQEGNTAGCEFNAALHVAVFDHLVRMAGGQLDPVPGEARSR